jgi:hypothetical protein
MLKKASGPAALATPGTRKRDLLTGEIASEANAPVRQIKSVADRFGFAELKVIAAHAFNTGRRS